MEFITAVAVFILIALAAFFSPAHAGAVAPVPNPREASILTVPGEFAWSTLNLRAGVIENEFEAYGDFFVPIWQGGDTVFYLQPYSRHTTGRDTDLGVGLGVRHAFSENWVLGVNAFYDNTFFSRGDADFNVNQLGFGVELIGTWVDFRANYYIPETKEHVIDSQRVSTSTSRSQTYTKGSSGVPVSDPYPTGYTISQDVTFPSTYRRTTTTTLSQLFETNTAAGQGWDAEVGVLVPYLDQWLETRVYAGYYSYDNKEGADISGVKARLETRLTEYLYVDAGWLEDEEVQGGNWYAGLRVSIPLGKVKAQGDSNVASSMRLTNLGYRSVARTALERVSEPVVRNSRAVITYTGTDEVPEERKITVKTKDKLISAGGVRPVILQDGIVYADSELGSATNPGTYEAPTSSIQSGVNIAAANFGNAGTVFVQGRTTAYVEPTVYITTNGVNITGSGVGLQGTSLTGAAYNIQGRTTSMPLVQGGFYANNTGGGITHLDMRGLEITGGHADSHLLAGGHDTIGTGVEITSVGNIVLTQNKINGNLDYGVLIRALQDPLSNITLSGNVISNNTNDGLLIRAANNSIITASIADNTVTGNLGSGVSLNTNVTATGNYTLTNNTISGNSRNGVVQSAAGNSTNIIALTGNTIDGNLYSGAALSTNAGATGTAVLTGNTISNNSERGVYFQANDTSINTVTLSENLISLNVLDQALASQEAGATLNFLNPVGTVTNLVIETPGDIDFLFNSSNNAVGGSILINGFAQPANTDLP